MRVTARFSPCIEYDHDEWPTASILRTVPSIQYKLSLFQWNLYIIELPRIVFGGNSTKIWNSARLIKLPIGFLRTVATTNSEEFCRNSRNRLWEEIFQLILFENFTSETISSKFFDTKVSFTQGNLSNINSIFGIPSFKYLLGLPFCRCKRLDFVCPEPKKGDLFFCLPTPNIMFLTHVLSNVKINFEEALGTLWKSLIFDPLLAEINRFLSTLWEKKCIFVISSQIDKYPACLHRTRVWGLFTGFEYNFCKKI